MPYRIPEPEAAPALEERKALSWDDIVLGGLLLVLATPRVVIALADGERFTPEPTLAAIGMALGVLLLVAGFLRRR